MTEAPKKEIWLTEQQCGDIADLLLEKETRCYRNAENCLSGYGTAKSARKAEEWREKAQYYNKLAEMLSEPWI